MSEAVFYTIGYVVVVGSGLIVAGVAVTALISLAAGRLTLYAANIREAWGLVEQVRAADDLARAVKRNTGNEPSESVMWRALDEYETQRKAYMARAEEREGIRHD